jgi:hypothetical protein
MEKQSITAQQLKELIDELDTDEKLNSVYSIVVKHLRREAEYHGHRMPRPMSIHDGVSKTC